MKNKIFTRRLCLVATILWLSVGVNADTPAWNIPGNTLTVNTIVGCHNPNSWIYEEAIESSNGMDLTFEVLTEAQGVDFQRVEKAAHPNNCGSAYSPDLIDKTYVKPVSDDSEVLGTVAFKHARFDGTWQFDATVRFSMPYQVAKIDPVFDGNGQRVGGTVYFYKVTQIIDEEINGWNMVNRLVLPHTLEYIPKNAKLNFPKVDTVFVYSQNLQVAEGKTNSFLPDKIKSVIFKDGVKSIPPYMCYNAYYLSHVSISNSVTHVGKNAFRYCSSLPVVNNLRYADTYLVEASTSSLTSYSLKAGTKWIGDHAFDYCKKMTSITLNEGLLGIGEYAFESCHDLRNFILPSTLTYVSQSSLSRANCIISYATNPPLCDDSYGINSIIFVPKESVEAYKNAKGWSRSAYYVYPYENKTTFEGTCGDNLSWSFDAMTNILDITGSGDMYDYTYWENVPWHPILFYIQQINMPDELTSIGAYAFYMAQSVQSISIPNGVKSIGEFAFAGCTEIPSISIPASVEVIKEDAFNVCLSLTDIQVDPANTQYCSVEGVLFSKDTTLLHTYPDNKSDSAYVIPKTVKYISDAAIYANKNLKSITIPRFVRTIGSGAFRVCKNLATINCEKRKPLELTPTAFEEVDKTTCKLYVPRKSINAYKEAAIWGDFVNILPLDDEPLGPPTPADLIAAGYDTISNVVVCFSFTDEAEVCNDVVLAGTYNNWDTNPAEMLKMQPLDNFEDWYVAQFPYTFSTNEKSEPIYPQAKPVQLKDDGTFSWDSQSGDVNAWTPKGAKGAYVVPGMDKEADVYYPEAGAYIYEISYWKNHKTLCEVIPMHKYSIILYAPNACDEMKPAISGGFNNWSSVIPMMPLLDMNDRFCYIHEVYTEEGTEFKFREVNDTDWSNQLQVDADGSGNWMDMGNISLPHATRDTFLFYDFSNNAKYRFKQCDPEPITVRLYPVDVPTWEKVYLFVWTNEGDNVVQHLGEWPGTQVGKDDSGWWSYTFPKLVRNINIIWNNGAGAQTMDIKGINSSYCMALYDIEGTSIPVIFLSCDVQIPTNLEQVNTHDTPRKVLENGVLYILRGEKVYTIQGQIVK